MSSLNATAYRGLQPLEWCCGEALKFLPNKMISNKKLNYIISSQRQHIPIFKRRWITSGKKNLLLFPSYLYVIWIYFKDHTVHFKFIFKKPINLAIPHLYNTFSYVEHWQKTKKEEIPKEIKIDAAKFTCFTYRRRLGSILYFNCLFVCFSQYDSINFNWINNTIRIPLLHFVYLLLTWKIRSSRSEKRRAAERGRWQKSNNKQWF